MSLFSHPFFEFKRNLNRSELSPEDRKLTCEAKRRVKFYTGAATVGGYVLTRMTTPVFRTVHCYPLRTVAAAVGITAGLWTLEYKLGKEYAFLQKKASPDGYLREQLEAAKPAFDAYFNVNYIPKPDVE